ncbi:hypothetical protein QM012_001517 [Aureobasidium pullulans]|uniref:Uncharacterized protein n=1 Tax=Aureobasidium pullulans TaxID=5580 RepID=A0ABR0TF79_AURPU
MRFENWDILLFPQVSGTPIQEFRTECFGVVTPIGLSPTLNAYIPSLPSGTPFKISLHSWSKPVISSPQFVRGNHIILAMHVAIDGKTVVVQKINPDGNFPHQILNSAASRLLFPPFHRTIRDQLQLPIADNVGRITVCLSEGYFYQAPATGKHHFSPVKDIVTFKWIHAPQNLLRKAGVAWPDPRLFIKSEHASEYGHVPHISYPINDESTSSEDSRFILPPSVATSDIDGPLSYPSSTAPLQALDQVFTGSDHLDFSDLTTSSDFASGYTFGAPLSDSIHALQPGFQQVQMTRLPSDQVREIANAIVPELIERGVAMLDGCSDTPPPERGSMRNVSDISMHTACDQYPACVVDDPDGKNVLHVPRKAVAIPTKTPRSRKRPVLLLTTTLQRPSPGR